MSQQQQNQFITPEQLQRQYLIDLIAQKRKKDNRYVSGVYAQMIVERVLAYMQDGKFKIDQNIAKIQDLLEEKELTESAKRLKSNQKKIQEKSRQHQLLYSNDKSLETLSGDEYPHNILSIEKHKEFMRQIKIKKLKREEKISELKLKQAKRKEKSVEEIEKVEQYQRIKLIDMKKMQIQQNLQKMRENHDKLLLNEKQAQHLMKKLRNKKRLHDYLKQTYEKTIVLPTLEQNKKILQQRRDNSLLNLEEIENHEKSYLQWKKSQQSLDRSSISKSTYRPPPHSKKMTRILAQQQKGKYALDRQKQLIKQKIERVNNYTAMLRERQKTPTVSMTIATTDRQKSQRNTELSRRQSANRNNIGNKYLQQARRALRRRAKTEQGQISTNVGQKGIKVKEKAISANYIDLKKRQRYVQKSKIEQIQRMLNCGQRSPEQKMKRLKQADDMLNIQIKKKQHKLKLKFSKQDSQSALDLLLAATKAKLNLLNCYEASQ